jgi:hypothetical protein
VATIKSLVGHIDNLRGCGLDKMCLAVAFRPELVDFLPELGPASGGVGQ